MSEDSGVSEQSAPGPEIGVETEPTGTESVSPPPKKADKKKLWVVIIAIIVVAALIGTAFYFLWGGKELNATIEQDPEGDIPAGDIVDLSVTVEWGDEDVTDDDDTDVEWSVSPATLGEFDRTRSTSVEFEAGIEGGSGTISCEVEYGDATYTATLEITILPPTLDSVEVVPGEKSLAIDEAWDFTATAVNSVGIQMSGATFTWAVTGMDAADYTLSNTSGAVTTFSASVEGNVTLTATGTVGSEVKSGTATILVGLNVSRTVDYFWYDMFNHPIEEWYDWRWKIGNEECRLTDEYPYLYLWEGSPPGNKWIYTFMRMDMDATNLSEVNMNENPEFLPFLSDTVRGGNAEIDWYLNYITEDEGWAKLGPGAMGYFDGWYVALNGTVTLDEQAARAVLNITTADFEDFDNWWIDYGGEVGSAWETWMIKEASGERLDIFWMYDYPLQFVLFDLDAEKDGDHIVLTFDTISWGAEALMTRWMKEAWMPTEWYFEDMTFQASIGPERSQISFDTAVQYAVYGYETTLEAEPCWDWEALMQDYVLSGIPPYENLSLYDRYWNWTGDELFTYDNYAPGSDWYAMAMPYDYAPGAWNLSEGETLRLEWPAGEQVFFVHDPGANDSRISEFIPDVSEVLGNMTVVYAEPMPSDEPDVVSIDTDARQITYTGPFDMWTWSREQTEHQWLADEWGRLSVLPYGMPFVEFRPESEGEPDLEISGLPAEVEMGEEVAFTVTAINELTLDVITSYTGTVTFESTDLAAVLPENYTFVPGDAGSRDFTVVFNTVDAETHDATPTLMVYDVLNSEMSASEEVHVVESPVVDHFDVVFLGTEIYADEVTSATVTAYNQWAEVYTDYDGIANFESDDVGADLPAPLNYTGLNGESVVDVTFSTDGDHYLNVSDSVVTEATGSAMVSVDPAAEPDHFDLSGVNWPAEIGVAETMTLTMIDQYGREFDGYVGTVVFDCNRSGDVTLPAATPWTPGETSIDVPLTFTAGGMFTVWANDSVDDTISGQLEVWVSDVVLELDHFEVTGITNMWENNYSSVTVTAITKVGVVFTTYEQYAGEIHFTSDAVSGDTLPGNYVFVPATDHGVKTFDMAVSFEDPGTYNVTVNDVAEPTKIGYQDNIVIEDLVATTLEAIASVETVMENMTFSMTVTVYHQYDLVFVEYDGTVTFDSTDTSGFAVLPGPYTFVPGDAGTHDFTGELSLSELGVQTVTVQDGSLSDTVDIEVIEYVVSELTYRIYDLFGEDWGPWWTTRVDSAWDTDRALTTGSGSMTWLYDAFDDGNVGIIYTPYRWNIQGTLLPNLNVHTPMFMPTFGGTQTGAEATVHIYGQYLTSALYDAQWVPYWETTSMWHSDYYTTVSANDDGWLFGCWVNVTMNREAALEWLGMPTDADPATWWIANRADYRDDYSTWIQDQGNEVYDIYCGYEYAYTDLYGIPPYGPIMDLEGDADEITLRIGDVTWGYEALLTRWLAASGLSMHQPYMEDFEMTLDYCDSTVNVSMDAVIEWSMKCVKQNASAVEWGAPCAWAWFPTHLDYIEGSGAHPVSAYDDYAPPLTYQSWNCGDPMYENETTYEYTPVQFTLPAYGRLIVDLPDGDVQGYSAEWVPSSAVDDAFKKTGASIAAYEALMYTGEMELGYCDLSGAAASEWHAGNKTLIVQGPWAPMNVHPADPSLMLTGAPWLEFNVVPTTMAASSAGMPSTTVLEEPTTAGSQATATSVTGELVSLATIICAVTMLIAALAAGAGRRYD